MSHIFEVVCSFDKNTTCKPVWWIYYYDLFTVYYTGDTLHDSHTYYRTNEGRQFERKKLQNNMKPETYKTGFWIIYSTEQYPFPSVVIKHVIYVLVKVCRSSQTRSVGVCWIYRALCTDLWERKQGCCVGGKQAVTHSRVTVTVMLQSVITVSYYTKLFQCWKFLLSEQWLNTFCSIRDIQVSPSC